MSDIKEKIKKLQMQFDFLQKMYYDLKAVSDVVGEEDNYLTDIIADMEYAKDDVYEYIQDLKEEL